MTELIIVRHGETVENTFGICQGQTEGTLSEQGIEQNKLLAEKLKEYKIHKIYSSPLNRAFETGNAIWKYHNKIELQKDKRLMEWNMGVLQGQKFPKDFTIYKPISGMENLKLVQARVKSFLDEILPQHKNQTIILVSHGLTIKVLTAMLMNVSDENINDIKLMKNSSFSVLNV
ncbi:MAG: hypothetical protein DRJ10_16425 [Bacteroidetes bacterium]|nr:MAG: hypothetical protein DRJ10_16425 [Bacteroidota bacterium]